jgi:hypothetical protein
LRFGTSALASQIHTCGSEHRVTTTSSRVSHTRRRVLRGLAYAGHGGAPFVVGAVAEDALDGLQIEIVTAAVVGQEKELGSVGRAFLGVKVVHRRGDCGNTRVAGEQHVLTIKHQADDHGAVVARVVAARIIEVTLDRELFDHLADLREDGRSEARCK